MSLSENKRTLIFTFTLCFLCALILSSLALLLEAPQKIAKEVDQSEQMLLAAQILNYNGSFQILENGIYVPARFEGQKLVVATHFKRPTKSEILAVYAALVHPMLVNDTGQLFTFAEANIDYATYVEQNKKKGYADLPLKLLYVIGDKEGFVIPVNGFGLWDAIYGYLALAADGDTVLGTTWYSQAETAGLGANIALPEWQAQFRNKLIFQPSMSGSTDFKRAPLGITVVKGKVSDLYGNTPKSLVSVDGISGATLTGNGVTEAYGDCLAPYRPFFVRLHETH